MSLEWHPLFEYRIFSTNPEIARNNVRNGTSVRTCIKVNYIKCLKTFWDIKNFKWNRFTLSRICVIGWTLTSFRKRLISNNSNIFCPFLKCTNHDILIWVVNVWAAVFWRSNANLTRWQFYFLPGKRPCQ